jgi:hypothetical protein
MLQKLEIGQQIKLTYIWSSICDLIQEFACLSRNNGLLCLNAFKVSDKFTGFEPIPANISFCLRPIKSKMLADVPSFHIFARLEAANPRLQRGSSGNSVASSAKY